MEHLKNILVAVDLGESSKQALAEARDLAGRAAATIHLLCVVQDPSALPWAPAAQGDMLTMLSGQMQRDAKAYLDALQRALERERLDAQVVVRVGSRPSAEILGYAAAKNIDLIVVGKGAHGSPEAAAEPRSVAEAVVAAAACAVLVVPARLATGHARPS
jgi:nucleotide-binding universal stress UspA family protein